MCHHYHDVLLHDSENGMGLRPSPDLISASWEMQLGLSEAMIMMTMLVDHIEFGAVGDHDVE